MTVPTPYDQQPPTVSLTSPAAGATVAGATTIAASASDNFGVTKVVFAVDGAAVGTATASPYTVKWDTTTDSDGSHALAATAYDAAGNASTASAQVDVHNIVPVDTTAPSTPGAPRAVVAGTTQLALYWSAATDNVGVDHYDVYRDGVKVGTTRLPNYLDSGLRAATSHKYVVIAVDAAGNQSRASKTLSIKTASYSATATSGTLAGIAYDAAGRPQANVVIAINGNGVTKTAKTGSSGYVKFNGLKPGGYGVTVTRPKSTTSTTGSATVLAGQTVLLVAP